MRFDQYKSTTDIVAELLHGKSIGIFLTLGDREDLQYAASTGAGCEPMLRLLRHVRRGLTKHALHTPTASCGPMNAHLRLVDQHEQVPGDDEAPTDVLRRRHPQWVLAFDDGANVRVKWNGNLTTVLGLLTLGILRVEEMVNQPTPAGPKYFVVSEADPDGRLAELKRAAPLD